MQIDPIDYLDGVLLSSPSKSYSHRAFVLALLANSPSQIINPLIEGDVGVTIDFCKQLGAKINPIKNPKYSDKVVVIEVIPPQKRVAPAKPINGQNSGTSIRLLTALSAVFPGVTRIYGTFFDRKRPLSPLLDALIQLGIMVKDTENPLGVELTSQHPTAGIVNIPGDISSQFITSLMYLAPQLQPSEKFHETIINLTTPAKSYPYLQISEEMLITFGIKFTVNFDSNLIGKYVIPAGQSYPGRIYHIPGDFSSAAFILVAAALNPFPKSVTIHNLNMQDNQGDKMIVSILKRAGAKITVDDELHEITIIGANILTGLEVDCSQIPDLFPILCVLGIFSEDRTRLYNASHVRIKETDRIAVMVRELRKMGAIIEEIPDGVIIDGPQSIKGIPIVHDQDHRIAMAMTIAGLYARSSSQLEHPEVVRDSFPKFFSDLREIGAKLTRSSNEKE